MAVPWTAFVWESVGFSDGSGAKRRICEEVGEEVGIVSPGRVGELWQKCGKKALTGNGGALNVNAESVIGL